MEFPMIKEARCEKQNKTNLHHSHQNDGSQPIETIICPVLVDHFLLLYLDKSLATLAPGSIAESKRRMTEKPHVYI